MNKDNCYIVVLNFFIKQTQFFAISPVLGKWVEWANGPAFRKRLEKAEKQAKRIRCFQWANEM